MHVRLVLPRHVLLLRCQVPLRPAPGAHVLHVVFQRALTAQGAHRGQVFLCGLEVCAQRGREREEGLGAVDGSGVGRLAFLARGGRELLGSVGPVGSGVVEGDVGVSREGMDKEEKRCGEEGGRFHGGGGGDGA